MVLLKLFLFTVTFCGLIVHSDASSCPKGKRVVLIRGGHKCEDCISGYYQDEEYLSKSCKVCTKCDGKSGSVVMHDCTKTTNTKCKCRGEFVPSESDSSTCKCDIGYGLNNGVCRRCDDGSFSASINLPCHKWKDCKPAGVNVTGTSTSDVICNEEPQSSSHVNAAPKVDFIDTSHRPHEGAPTQEMPFTTTTFAPRHVSTLITKVQPFLSSQRVVNHHFGILMTFAVVGILALTAVTCKLYIAPYMERQQSVQKHGSQCGKPVEEIGDSSQMPLKPNTEEN